MSKKRAERERRGIFRDYGLAIGSSILIALFIRFFIIEAYRMPSRAMQPSVEPGDTLFVSKFAYGFRLPGGRISKKMPEYGDVVVLEFPDEPSREYIKRVVGLPGDKIQFSKGALVLNGKTALAPTPLPEPSAKPGAEVTASELCSKETLPNEKTYEVCFEPPIYAIDKEVTVPPDSVYVVGDLRSIPYETRNRLKYGGVAPVDGIKGRAMFVWLSIQPPGPSGTGGDWFSRIRIDRLFRRIQ